MNGTWRRVLGVALATAALTGPAAAASLMTAPLRVPNGRMLDCQLLNGGKKDLSGVVIQATIAGGGLGDTTGPLTVASEATASLVKQNATAGASAGWCRFDFKGPRRNVRAAGCVLDADLGCTASAPAQ